MTGGQGVEGGLEGRRQHTRRDARSVVAKAGGIGQDDARALLGQGQGQDGADGPAAGDQDLQAGQATHG